MRFVIWSPKLANVARTDSYDPVGRQIAALQARVEEAASSRAQVFIAPEFLFALNLDNEAARAGPVTDSTYCIDAPAFAAVRQAVELLSRSYPALLIVAGTALWSDGGDARNTALVGHHGRCTSFDQSRPANQTEANMMTAGGLQARSQQPFSWSGTVATVPTEAAICSDLCCAPAPSTRLMLVPGYGLGGLTPNWRYVRVVADGYGSGSGAYYYDHGLPMSRQVKPGLEVLDVPDAVFVADPPSPTARWVPRLERERAARGEQSPS